MDNSERVKSLHMNLIVVLVFGSLRRSMSGQHLNRYGHQRKSSKGHSKDFLVATPEEFVKRFGGDCVVNKVRTEMIIKNC